MHYVSMVLPYPRTKNLVFTMLLGPIHSQCVGTVQQYMNCLLLGEPLYFLSRKHYKIKTKQYKIIVRTKKNFLFYSRFIFAILFHFFQNTSFMPSPLCQCYRSFAIGKIIIVMSETESSYDFDHYTEESIMIPANDTFVLEPEEEESYRCASNQYEVTSKHEESYEHNSSYHESSSSISVHAPISFMKSTFQQLDKEGKGVISKSVLKRATMLTSEQYDRRIIRQEIDKCSKEINYSRFVQIFQKANIGDGGLHEWLYSLFDPTHRGFITAEDLHRAATATGVDLSEQEIGQMLATERNCGNGRVDYEDFCYIMQEEIQYL